jgi:hypothetical protein
MKKGATLKNAKGLVQKTSGDVTNTKMCTKIYTGSGRQSVIPYIQCGWVSALLIFVSSIEKLITGGLQA